MWSTHRLKWSAHSSGHEQGYQVQLWQHCRLSRLDPSQSCIWPIRTIRPRVCWEEVGKLASYRGKHENRGRTCAGKRCQCLLDEGLELQTTLISSLEVYSNGDTIQKPALFTRSTKGLVGFASWNCSTCSTQRWISSWIRTSQVTDSIEPPLFATSKAYSAFSLSPSAASLDRSVLVNFVPYSSSFGFTHSMAAKTVYQPFASNNAVALPIPCEVPVTRIDGL